MQTIFNLLVVLALLALSISSVHLTVASKNHVTLSDGYQLGIADRNEPYGTFDGENAYYVVAIDVTGKE